MSVEVFDVGNQFEDTGKIEVLIWKTISGHFENTWRHHQHPLMFHSMTSTPHYD
jgi:hypothetical protein